MRGLRVLLADDHALVRAGIRALLDGMPGVKVVGEVADGLQALAAIGRLRPDLLLLDITMPGLNGLEVTTRVARDHPGVKVLILSMHSHEEYVKRAMQAGAAGYLLKDAATIELQQAIATVAGGEAYLSPLISRGFLAGHMALVAGVEPPSVQTLTPRQGEILTMVAQGLSTKEIAFALGRSVKTVETHRAQLMERLGIHDVPGLVKYAMRAGFIPPAE